MWRFQALRFFYAKSSKKNNVYNSPQDIPKILEGQHNQNC